MARGRLKLREQRPGSAQLIQYAREDRPQPRPSNYQVAPVPDAELRRAMLDACLGTRVVVTKRRRLFVWRGVRIHIDDVDGLGTFIELEAVAGPESDLGTEHALIGKLRDQFAITDDRLISISYADQLMKAP